MLIEQIPINLGNNSAEANVCIYSQDASPELAIVKRPTVLICPGGGYAMVSEREAEPIVTQVLCLGYNAAVVTYSVTDYPYPIPYLEAFTALKILKDNADKYNIDTDRIMIGGFSAGAHLAGLVGTGCQDPLVLEHFGVDKDFFKLSGMLLAYPVINGGEFAHRGSFDNLLGPDRKDDPEWIKALSIDNRVDENTPPVFLWHTCKDTAVPLENSLLMISALRKYNIPMEVHIFPTGRHGLSLCSELTFSDTRDKLEPACVQWIELWQNWMKRTFGNILN